MKRPMALLPAGERRVAAEVLVGLALVAVGLARVQGIAGLAVVSIAFLLAGSLLLVVEAPIGAVPLGYALIMAIAVLADASTYFALLGLGVTATVPVLVVRYGQADTIRRVVRWLVAGSACGLIAAGLHWLLPGGSSKAALIQVTVSGTIFLGVDLLLRDLVPTSGAPPVRLAESWPVHLSLLCAAGLLAAGYREEHWMALVALVPLVLTRFAYDRLAAAEQAYRQTIKALSIVPEVAGVTPIGHGERSAVYAVAMARELGLSRAAVERLATAARLHHIGYVTVDDPREALDRRDRRYLARLGGEILRETRFLADVGDLVEGIHEGGSNDASREVAVLRVATEFDDLVLDDPAMANGAIALVASRQHDAYGAAAVLALRRVLESDELIVDRAIASAAPLAEAAATSWSAHG